MYIVPVDLHCIGYMNFFFQPIYTFYAYFDENKSHLDLLWVLR
jgi:hypothetical protein